MPVIEVNGERIPAAQIRARAAMLREEARAAGRQLTPDESLEILGQAEILLIDRVLLRQEALRRRISVMPEAIDGELARVLPPVNGVTAVRAEIDTVEVRADINSGLLIEGLLEHWTRQQGRVPVKQLRLVYQRNKKEFWTPEFVFVSQIVRNLHHPEDRERLASEMQSVHEQLCSGADFGALVAAHSDCPEEGGRLGYIARKEMVPEFDEVIFATSEGAITPVFETRFGFHIARVDQYRPEGIRPFDEVAGGIERSLLRKGLDKFVAARLDQLREEAIIRRLSS